MSNQTITPIEFQKFQEQLISLKESKYKTEEKCEYLIRHKSQLESKCLQLERDLTKANELKTRFKSAREMEILMNENQLLRDRLSAIEGNFKLQNDIIRTECENLFSENERLKSQIETYKSAVMKDENREESVEDSVDSVEEESGGERERRQYQVRYLQHEVTKLLEEKAQVALKNEALQIDIDDLRGTEAELKARVDWLLGEKTRLSGEAAAEREKSESEASLGAERLERCVEAYEADLRRAKEDAERRLEEVGREWEARMRESEERREREVREAEERLASVEEEKRRAEDTWKEERQRFEERVAFAEEELRVAGRKNQMQMRDVRRQLEREVRLGLEAQARLEEAAAASSGSQNSQAFPIGERVVCRSPMGNTDDQSSVYSSDVMSGNAGGGGGVGTLTDDELKNLLDRFTSVQNDLCESKRFIESLKSDKDQLIKTVNQQQNIILNYIKNRGGSDCETGSGGSTDESERRVNNHHHNNSNHHHHHSTSEALILNGLMSSPPAPMSQFSLQSLVGKVKDSLKSIASKDILYSGDSSKPEVCRVTTAEVKQLQRVCEELMMRCLNLETDLQLSLDINTGLQKRLTSACVCHHSSDPD